MTDEWEGTWGEPESAAAPEPVVPDPVGSPRLSRRSRLIVLGAVAALLVGLVVTNDRGGERQPEHAFIKLQADGVTPVGHNPCGSLRVTVNTRTGPRGAVELVERAVGVVASVTGMDISVKGTTNAEPHAGPNQLPRSEAGAIRVFWSDEEESPELKGRTLGAAGSAEWAELHAGRMWYAFGQVLLDGPDLEGKSDDAVVAVIVHELGHVLGLDHVKSSGEIMHAWSTRTTLGPGDREGFAALGALECPGGGHRR